MIAVLQTTTQKLQVVLAGAVAANQADITCIFYDHIPQLTTTLNRRAHKVTNSNNTTDVDIVEAPGLQGTIRNIENITVNNKDTAPITATVKMDDGGTETILVRQTISSGESLVGDVTGAWNVLSPITPPFVDTTAIIKGSTDATKLVRLEADGLTTATTRVAEMPDANIKLAGHATGLTATRIPIATGTTGGVLTDSANLTFNTGTNTLGTTNVTATGIIDASDGAAASPSVKVGDEENGLFSPATNELAIGTAGAEALRIDAGQRLLLGHTATLGRLGQLLEATVSATHGGLSLNTFSTTASHRPVLDFQRSKSATKGTHTVVANNDQLGVIVFRGSDGANFQNAAEILGDVDGTPGSGDMPGRLVFATTADGAATVTEAMRIDRNQCVGINNTNPSAVARLAVTESALRATERLEGAHADTIVSEILASSGSYAGKVVSLLTNTASGSGFDFLQCFSDQDGTPDLEVRVRGDGVVTADGSFTGSGADYQEYLESVDGSALPVGSTVVRAVGKKIRLSTPGDPPERIIGVVRPKEDNKNSAVIGNAAWNRWTDKYLTDEYGRYVLEEYKVYEWEDVIPAKTEKRKVQRKAKKTVMQLEAVIVGQTAVLKPREIEVEEPVFREFPLCNADDSPVLIDGKPAIHREPVMDDVVVVLQGEKIAKRSHADYKMPAGVVPPKNATVKTLQKRKLNPAWSKDATYVPRHDRPEWNLIGMLGQVQITKGQPVDPRWECWEQISENVELWFIR